MGKRIGVVAVGGDCPGSNAALRGFGKTALFGSDVEVIGFLDGFEGMANDQHVELTNQQLSGILTEGGTILGTSRAMPADRLVAGAEVELENLLAAYRSNRLDCLVILGGTDAQEGGYLLSQQDIPVLTLPLTIDNDLLHTDVSIGFDSAMNTAAEAIDRLHTTAYSQHRMMIVEVMGKQTGWLALGAGVAGGADVILIPEIPYDEDAVMDAVLNRKKAGKRYSIVAVSEGALSSSYRSFFQQAQQANIRRRSGNDQAQIAARLSELEKRESGNTIHLANILEQKTGLATRITILGYLQRGGSPTAFDRALATQMGSYAAEMAREGSSGGMVALQQGCICLVPLDKVIAGQKTVPQDHYWVSAARSVGTCMGN